MLGLASYDADRQVYCPDQSGALSFGGRRACPHGLAPWGHSSCGVLFVGLILSFYLRLPAPLCSTGITPLLSSYGRSDSPVASRTSLGLPDSRHNDVRPFCPQPRLMSPQSFFHAVSSEDSGFATHSQARRHEPPNRVRFSVFYGPVVRLALLSTPPYDDAVTFGYEGTAAAPG